MKKLSYLAARALCVYALYEHYEANIAVILAIIPLWLQLTANLRRLRDTGLPIWLMILVIVPIANIAFGFFLLFAPTLPEKDEPQSTSLNGDKDVPA